MICGSIESRLIRSQESRNATSLDVEPSIKFLIIHHRVISSRPIGHIVSSISTWVSFPRWVLEFAFHGSLSPECESFGKLNKSNRFRACDWCHNCFPILYLKIYQDTFRMEYDQRIIVKFLSNEEANARNTADRLQAQFDEYIGWSKSPCGTPYLHLL
jgi:hypothetical protein